MNLMNCANAVRRRCALVLWVVAVSVLSSANLVAAEAVLTLDAAVRARSLKRRSCWHLARLSKRRNNRWLARAVCRILS